MSEVTEQEAREASSTHEECSRKFFAGELFGIKAHDDFSRSGTTLIEFARQELARRDAKRAEREKPITAEWLESIGFYRDTTEGRYFEQQEIAGAFYLRNNGRLAWRCEVYELFEAETRGQLLDILNALRGGA